MSDENDPLENPLDSLIDRALGSYTPRGERPGLEYRILASATAERLSRFYRWNPVWVMALAALLLAVVAVPAWYRLMHPGGGGAQPLAIATAEAPPQPASGSRAVAGPARKPRDVAARPAAGATGALARPKSGRPARLAGAAATEESMAGEPIVFRPITLAPIEIRALN
jgi:hypothetical protein